MSCSPTSCLIGAFFFLGNSGSSMVLISVVLRCKIRAQKRLNELSVPDLSVRFSPHPGQVCYLEQLRWMNLARRDLSCLSATSVFSSVFFSYYLICSCPFQRMHSNEIVVYHKTVVSPPNANNYWFLAEKHLLFRQP